MTLTSRMTLHPGPPSAYVVPAFFGGPLDGDYRPPVSTSDLRGRIEMGRGRYELVGFKASGDSLPKELRELCMDYAVYEWA